MRQLVRARPVTYEDRCRVPDHLVAEILDGDLFATPRPALPHARAGGALGVEIGGPFVDEISSTSARQQMRPWRVRT